MERPTLPFFLGMIAMILPLSGCQCQTDPAGAAVKDLPGVMIDPARATPEACYTAFQEAWNKHDFETAFRYLSPRAEEYVGASYVVMIGLWQGMGTQEMRESPFGQALEQLLAEHGIRSLGRRMRRRLGPGEDDDDRQVAALLATGRDLGPSLAFSKALYDIDVEHNKHRRLEFFSERFDYGPLSEVNTNGDTALGWFGMWDLMGELSVEFIRAEDGWMIDMIYPGPLEERNGNRHRDLPNSEF